MKMIKLGMVLVASLLVGIHYGESTNGALIQSNVFETVRSVYTGNSISVDDAMIADRFQSVRGGGVSLELEGTELMAFSNLCSVVSNHASFIANSWQSYATNECVRFSVLSAICYSGQAIFTNFTDRILAYYEMSPDGSSDSSYYPVIKFLLSPYGTPTEKYFVNDYDQFGVSNLLMRISSVFSTRGHTNEVMWCSRILSGETKQMFLQEETDGDR